jgi:hypothetical protein
MRSTFTNGDAALQTNVLQVQYDSELNFELSCFWDGGLIWKLGDSANGYSAEGHAETVNEAIKQLRDAALTHFPQSGFTKLMIVSRPQE